MKRIIAILGTLLITIIIIISGSAVAWTYAGSVYSSTDCVNPDNALDAPDDLYATVGTNVPDPTTGDLWLDFGNDPIPNSYDFWVFGTNGTGIEEEYTVRVYQSNFLKYGGPWTDNNDTMDHYFTTGVADLGQTWQYVWIQGEDGSTGPGDPIYGPEIDAVGFN